MSSVLDLRCFTRDALEQLGCLVESHGGDALEAVLTPSVAHAMGLEEMARLSFENREPASVVLQPGQPCMDALLDLCTAEAIVSHRLLALPDRRSKATAVAQDTLGFPNSRPDWGDESWGLSRWIRCGFLASFISDERRDLVEQVTFDLTRACLVDSPPQGEPAQGENWGEQTAMPLSSALSRCADVAMDRLQRRVASWLKRCADRADIDQARAREYFETLESELRRRLRSAEQRQADTSSVQSKLANLRQDAERRQRDLTEKHQVRSILKLAVFEWIEAPRGRVPVTISNRYATAKLDAWYNPYTRRVDPPACRGCGQPTARVWLCNQGHVVCDDCALPCNTCRRVQCQDCTMGTCPRCSKLWCDTCRRVKPGCTTCGVSQCENCAAIGSCHTVKPKPPPAAEQPPVSMPSRLVVRSAALGTDWSSRMPLEAMVRATTSDAEGWMAVLFNVQQGGDVATVGVRWNLLTHEIARLECGPMRIGERRTLQRALLPPQTSWMELRWPYPVVMAAWWLEEKLTPELTRQVRRLFPLLSAASPAIDGPPGQVTDAVWDLEPLHGWTVAGVGEISRRYGYRFEDAKVWKLMVANAHKLLPQAPSLLQYRLMALLVSLAYAVNALPYELEILQLARDVPRQGFTLPAMQALLRRTFERSYAPLTVRTASKALAR